MIDQRLKVFDCVKKGWVMAGFPQTREQALAMQVKGIFPSHVGKINKTAHNWLKLIALLEEFAVQNDKRMCCFSSAFES